MQEAEKEQVALFRYGIISPVLNGQVENQKQYFEQEALKKHHVPYYGLKEFTPKTFKTWLYKYRTYGFDGLKPQSRKDIGSSRVISGELAQHLLSLRQEARLLPVSLFYDQLVEKGEIIPSEVSFASLYRLLRKHGLTGKTTYINPGRKRFSHEKVNALWQGDLSDGPYLNIGGCKKQTFLFAFIDDCSRVVPFAQFFLNEKFDSLKIAFKEALIRKGIPKILYVDNGKIYRSQILQVACASLGIILTHTQPYDAASKGKIERFFGTVKTRFFPLLKQNPVSSLEELNARFFAWLESDYHHKPHSSLDGKTPLGVYMSQASSLKMVDDPASLDPLFLKREKRKVKHDSTISVAGCLYEVPPRFIGQSIEIRIDESDVFIYEDGKPLCKAVPVDFHVNAQAKRSSPISFKDLLNERSNNHV